MIRPRPLGWLVLAVAGCARPSPGAEADAPALGNQQRVVAEVLNASGTSSPRRGLARIGARYLRERGVDVVYYGTADTMVDSTLVLVRRGDLERGRDVARVLGGTGVVARPDSTLRVDVTVLLGRYWSPGPDPRP
ncbi:MAG TPA: LytR C-terminal domain-containing protein [Gemmatimonadales bacterium]